MKERKKSKWGRRETQARERKREIDTLEDIIGELSKDRREKPDRRDGYVQCFATDRKMGTRKFGNEPESWEWGVKRVNRWANEGANGRDDR